MDVLYLILSGLDRMKNLTCGYNYNIAHSLSSNGMVERRHE